MKSEIRNPKSEILSVLLVEDNPGDARLIREMLAQVRDPLHTGRQAFDLECADRLSTGLERLAVGGIDVVLLDLSLPDSQGLETFLKIHDQAPGVPVVVITGLDDETLAVQAVHEGAQDYLVKGQVTGSLLARSIRYAIERQRLLAALEQTRQQQLRMKDQFLSHVSHELRSPLAAIYQFVTILLDGLAGDLRPEQREHLEVALRNVNRLRTMIGDLLEATRAETAKLTVEPRRISAGEIIAETLSTLRTTAATKGVILSAGVPPDLPPVHADPNRLRQILVNLIDNGIKFTPENGTVCIQVHVFDEDPSFLCFAVADTGCGIRPEETKMIFERLYQTTVTIQDRRKGLGLGLYICRELVSRHGGRIWVESQLGQGSTFFFTLPVFPRSGSAAPQDGPDKIGAGSKCRPGSGDFLHPAG